MQKNSAAIKMKLLHAFGSSCSKMYKNCITICDEQKNEPKIVFPAGKTLVRKFIDRQEMDFINFSQNSEFIQAISILPTRTHVAVAEKILGTSSQIIRIYNFRNKTEEPNTIKIFHDSQKSGVINSIVFSPSQPKFMCCLVGEPHNRLIYIDTSKNKPLAESNTLKDAQKITISPNNSHLICISGNSSIKLFKVEQYAFKPLQQIGKIQKGRRITDHSWYKKKILLAATDKSEILFIQQSKGVYQVKQQYRNVFNEQKIQKMIITSICPFSKGFILGSSTGKFCLWVKKEDSNNEDEEAIELARKWGTTQERCSEVTGIAISVKEDMIAVSLANNDIATLYLSQLLPRASDLMNEHDTDKKVFFEYLYKGFHNAKITGMDICHQRPLIATCSREDNTIRIWNYKNFGCKLLRMFYFKIKDNPKDDNPLITLTFHPSGYYLAVGCTDKLRLFHVLNSQLRPYRQIGLRNCNIVTFSHGGHLLATCSPARQDFDAGIIKIYNSLTLQELISLKDHQNRIDNLQWKRYDEYLYSTSSTSLIQWKVYDWIKVKHYNTKTMKIESSTYDNSRNAILLFGTTHDNTFVLEQHNCETGSINTIGIDAKVTTMKEIEMGKQKAILLGFQNGSISVFGGVTKPIIYDRLNYHTSRIVKFVISPCGRYAVSIAEDAIIFVYSIYMEVNGIIRFQQITNSTVDDFLADVVLLPKGEIIKYNQKQEEYNKVLNGLSKKLKQSSLEGEKRFQAKIQQIQMQKNRVIQDYCFRIERIKQQISMLKKKNENAINDLDAGNLQEAVNLQKKYQAKLAFEREKYFQLQQEILQSKVMTKNRIKIIQAEQSSKIQILKDEFANKFENSEKIYTLSKGETEEANKIFDQRIKQIQNQQDQEIREVKEKKEKFKRQSKKALDQLSERLAKLGNDKDKLIRERDSEKQRNQELLFNKKKLIREVEDAKEKFKQMSLQFDEKVQILGQKQKKLSDFETKITDLQKNKHILTYKASQMRKAIQPKQIQIARLKEDLINLKKQFEQSLENKQRAVLEMQKLEKERQYMQKNYKEELKQTSKKQSTIDQILYDIHNCIKGGDNSDHKLYQKEFIKLYHKYVEKNEKKLHNQDPKGLQEMTKQIVHLEKSLYQQNISNQKALLRRNEEIDKRTKESGELLNLLNEIIKQNQQISVQIKKKREKVQQLKTLRNSIMTQCKKDTSILSNDKPYERIKMAAIETISKVGGQYPLLDPKVSYHKKQNEIISEIQFMSEKIHKMEFITSQLRDKIKRHFVVFKCTGQVINQDNI